MGATYLNSATVEDVLRDYYRSLSFGSDLPTDPDTDELTEYANKLCNLFVQAVRTCKPLGIIRYDYEGGYSEYEIELSCGHKWLDTYGSYPNYCPYCGAKIL